MISKRSLKESDITRKYIAEGELIIHTEGRVLKGNIYVMYSRVPSAFKIKMLAKYNNILWLTVNPKGPPKIDNDALFVCEKTIYN